MTLCSIIGDGELNFRVRNGVGCTLSSMATKEISGHLLKSDCVARRFALGHGRLCPFPSLSTCAPCHISKSALKYDMAVGKMRCQNILIREEGFFLRNKTHGLLVPVSSTPRGASTSGLSTRSSTSALQDLRRGELILRQASRLDAFSGYPFHT